MKRLSEYKNSHSLARRKWQTEQADIVRSPVLSANLLNAITLLNAYLWSLSFILNVL
jgi:hypothetical protein